MLLLFKRTSLVSTNQKIVRVLNLAELRQLCSSRQMITTAKHSGLYDVCSFKPTSCGILSKVLWAPYGIRYTSFSKIYGKAENDLSFDPESLEETKIKTIGKSSNVSVFPVNTKRATAGLSKTSQKVSVYIN